MIIIQEKSQCCGCSACVQVCPNHCISLVEDEEGFLYPHVNELCTGCDICETVCPIKNQGAPQTPQEVIVGINPSKDERINSSSGGVFIMLAHQVIDQGGIVFGARWDGFLRVVHDYADDYKGVIPFMGSKYVQSEIGDSYRNVESFLKSGRLVLFSGTPCQISGLYLFLRHKYDNLITVDIACHGVPSPLVWRNWLEMRFKSADSIHSVNHRAKRFGWANYCVEIQSNNKIFWQYHDNNDFFKAYSFDLTLRPSCFECPSKSGKSHSDITLADMWGVDRILPSCNDDLGTSSVLINSEKGLSLISELRLTDRVKVDYSEILRYNPSLEVCPQEPLSKKLFFKAYNGHNIHHLVKRYCKSPFLLSFKIRIYRIIKRLRNSLIDENRNNNSAIGA